MQAKRFFSLSANILIIGMLFLGSNYYPNLVLAQTSDNPSQPTRQPISPTPVVSGKLCEEKQKLDLQASEASGLLAAPYNDDFDSAIAVTSSPFIDLTNTIEATVAWDDPNMGCGSGINSNTVWYRISVPSFSSVTVNTFGTNYDTVIAAYTGSRGALVLINCNDDFVGLQSEIEFYADTGVDYFLEVADYGSPGGGQLSLQIEFLTLGTIDVPLDIVLLQDETGSMGDDIGSLKSLAPQIWDSIAAISKAEFRMAVAGFRDYGRDVWGESGDWVYRLLSDFTTFRGDFVNAVENLTAAGGYDEPESQYAALHYLLNASHPCIDSNGNGNCLDPWDTQTDQQPNFRSGATRVILLATDASFHDPDDTFGYPEPYRDTVISSLFSNRAILIGLVPGGAGIIPEVDDLSTITGGSTQNTGGSGEDIAAATLAALQTVRPVDPDLSTVNAVPTSVVADGSSISIITVTLRDTAGNPVAGRDVLIFSDRGGEDIILQPAVPTDPNGETYGAVNSIAKGTSHIWAVDVTDGVQINQQAIIQFTLNTIPPSEELVRCIQMLGQNTSRQFNALSEVSVNAADDAQYFNNVIGADKAEVAYDVIWGFVSVAIPASGEFSKAVGWKLPGFLDPDWGAVKWLKAKYPNAGNIYDQNSLAELRSVAYRFMPPRVINNGLIYYAAELANSSFEELTNEAAKNVWGQIYAVSSWNDVPGPYIEASNSLQQAVEELQSNLVSGVPEMSELDMNAFANDLCRRAFLPIAQVDILTRQAELTHNLRDAHENTGETDGLGWFLMKFMVRSATNILWDGIGTLIFDSLTWSLDSYVDSNKLDASQRGFLTAQGFFNGIPDVTTELFSNLYQGYEQVQIGRTPNTVQGEIVETHQISEGRGFDFLWLEDKSYSLIDVKNTGDEAADYLILVEYGYDTKLFGLPWVYNPVIAQTKLRVEPGQTKTIQVDYKNGERGGSPKEDQYIGIFLLSTNSTGNFQNDFYAEPWNPEKILATSSIVDNKKSQLNEYSQTVENPIDSYLFANSASGNSEGKIFVANPFINAITATITQSIPSSATIINTDGIVDGSIITWEVVIPASDIISLNYTIYSASYPGEVISLPSAQLTFVEPSSSASIVTASNIPTVQSPWPITLAASTPTGEFGSPVDLTVTVKNITSEIVSGSIKALIHDPTGVQVYDIAKPFSTEALSEGSVIFVLPGTLRPGVYSLEVWVKIGEAETRMLIDLYKVEGQEIFLPLMIR